MRVLFGIVFIIAAVVFLLLSVAPAVIEHQALLDLWQPIYCDAGDQLTAERIVEPTFDGGTGFSAIYACVRQNGATYDVTAKSWVITGVGFTVPLLLGILMIVVSGRSQREDEGDVLQQQYRMSQYNAARRQGQMPSVTVMSASMDAAPSAEFPFDVPDAPQAGGLADLSRKLEELQTALEHNLITRAEYDQKREEILREF